MTAGSCWPVANKPRAGEAAGPGSAGRGVAGRCVAQTLFRRRQRWGGFVLGSVGTVEPRKAACYFCQGGRGRGWPSAHYPHRPTHLGQRGMMRSRKRYAYTHTRGGQQQQEIREERPPVRVVSRPGRRGRLRDLHGPEWCLRSPTKTKQHICFCRHFGSSADYFPTHPGG